MFPSIGALLVAISRTEDYRHHWQDVFIGSLLGKSSLPLGEIWGGGAVERAACVQKGIIQGLTRFFDKVLHAHISPTGNIIRHWRTSCATTPTKRVSRAVCMITTTLNTIQSRPSDQTAPAAS